MGAAGGLVGDSGMPLRCSAAFSLALLFNSLFLCRSLPVLQEEMVRHGIEAEEYTPAEFDTWVTNQRDTLSREHRGLSLLDYWETIISERHRDYLAIKTERDRTAATLYQAVQRRLVIDHAKAFFLEAAAGGFGSDVTSPPAGTAGTEPGALQSRDACWGC